MEPILIQMLLATSLIIFGILVAFICRQALGEPSSSQNKLKHLEGLRALAALAVVSCHVTQHVFLHLGFSVQPETSNRLGILSVQMFFGLTAFLFSRRILAGTLDVAAFFLGRIRRLLPLYIAVCMAAICLVQLHHPLSQPLKQTCHELYAVFTYGLIGANGVTLQGHNMLSLIGAAWTLHYEWCFYLLLPLLALFFRSKTGITIMLLLFMLAMAQDFSLSKEVVWPFFLPGVLAAFAEKYLPVAQERLEKKLQYMAILLLAASLWLPGFFSFTHLMVSTLLFLCVFLSKPKLLQSDTLQYLAQISYSVYLLQYLVITPVMGLANHPGIFATNIAMGIYALLVMFILVPLSHFSYRYIELPWMDAYYRWNYLQRLKWNQ